MKIKLFGMAIAFLLLLQPIAQISADGCYLCGSGSSGCQQCRYGSSDTQDQRKKCEKAGCKVSGTSSCSTAANIKVCTAMINPTFKDMVACDGKGK